MVKAIHKNGHNIAIDKPETGILTLASMQKERDEARARLAAVMRQVEGIGQILATCTANEGETKMSMEEGLRRIIRMKDERDDLKKRVRQLEAELAVALARPS